MDYYSPNYLSNPQNFGDYSYSPNDSTRGNPSLEGAVDTSNSNGSIDLQSIAFAQMPNSWDQCVNLKSHLQVIRELSDISTVELREEIDSHPPPPKQVKYSFQPGSDYREVIKESLETTGGVCFGEAHDEEEPKKFLVDHMAWFAELGVKVLFMEELYLHQQGDLDFFYSTGILPNEFKKHLDGNGRLCHFDGEYSYQGIVEAARNYGIRVIAIDNYSSSMQQNLTNRLIFMNFVAHKIMRVTLQEYHSPFIAFMGKAHLRSQGEEVIGVADWIDSVAVDLTSLPVANQVRCVGSSPFGDVRFELPPYQHSGKEEDDDDDFLSVECELPPYQFSGKEEEDALIPWEKPMDVD